MHEFKYKKFIASKSHLIYAMESQVSTDCELLVGIFARKVMEVPFSHIWNLCHICVMIT